jgi:nucleoside-diphosphate-sugar epimerase
MTSTALSFTPRPGAWKGVPERNTIVVDLLVDSNRTSLLDRLKPRTVFNCVGYGGYSFEAESDLIYETNFNLTAKLLRRLEALGSPATCIPAARRNTATRGRPEGRRPAAAQQRLRGLQGCLRQPAAPVRQEEVLPCANLRLFSVYGPYEDASRLIPTLVRSGLEGKFPPLRRRRHLAGFRLRRRRLRGLHRHRAQSARAVLRRFVQHRQRPQDHHRRGRQGAAELFSIPGQPSYGAMERRKWDIVDWFSDQKKTAEVLRWKARTEFRRVLRRTADWYRGLEDKERYYPVLQAIRRWTRNAACPRWWLATRTPRPSPSCTSG